MESPYYPIFKPRWRFGITAARQAAFVQVPLYVSLGVFCLLGAFHSKHAQLFAYLFLAFALLSAIIFFVDWGSVDEP
ncbi:hypothetical protein ASD72_15890 [Pseudoxanthomonas sp. Root630]|nr:hypothetical protein ASD72_15890 [Pseudoxanthomonas sp. Root630]